METDLTDVMDVCNTKLALCSFSSTRESDTCKPIGDWFDLLFIGSFDWCSASEEQMKRCNDAEDFLIMRLCQEHDLPPPDKRCECSFTANELARQVTPEVQLEIWEEILARFSDKTP